MEKRALTGAREKEVMKERSGSSGSIEEMWKRGIEKKREREEEEVFRTGKKTVRSPDLEERMTIF